MSEQKVKISLLTDDQRQAAIDAVVNFYATERDEQIGMIAVEELVDMFLERIGNAVYNKGLDDATLYFKEHAERAESDIEVNLRKLD